MFDEAQRAWTREKTAYFMKTKKGVDDFKLSEPEFLIGVFDRHEDWATIICLIGGGQEINTGEAGLPEWFSGLANKFHDWQVYISGRLTDYEYTRGQDIFASIEKNRLSIEESLHLSVSVRSFRAEKVSTLVKELLDCRQQEASALYQELSKKYPIMLTRNLDRAKTWLRKVARGNE
ncbi:DUF2075 domain-containing protein, partial [bacterium]|nr:DUF2075 domain-containing protein [bacterium]